jgi:hypothetical protein
MTKKLSPSQQWMVDHPDDVPCPLTPCAAKAWRMKRGLVRPNEQMRKYEAAMAEKRAAASMHHKEQRGAS